MAQVDKIYKNFYIPLESVKEYLQKTYHVEINDIWSAKYCVEQLLESIRNEFGEQFLNFNGLCVYLSTKEKTDNIIVYDFDIEDIDEVFDEPDLIIDDKKYYLNKSIDNRQQEISSINFDGEEFDEIIKQIKNVQDNKKKSSIEGFSSDYYHFSEKAEELAEENARKRKEKRILKFSQKYLDTYRDGRIYFKDEIIIDDTGTKSKIYNGYQPMEYC